jgi:hypothetical protein
MKLPSKIRVGRKKYVIHIVRGLSRSRRGHWSADTSIVLSKNTGLGTAYTPKQMSEAFWHETTHAILHDMNHPLWDNEEFVEAFAKRLNNAIYSAEFE